MFEELQRLIDEHRALAPWIEWAIKNPVRLHLTAYAPIDSVYSLAPVITDEYTVVAHPVGWKKLRRLFEVGPLPISDRALAEMIAWHYAELREPSEQEPQ